MMDQSACRSKDQVKTHNSLQRKCLYDVIGFPHKSSLYFPGLSQLGLLEILAIKKLFLQVLYIWRAKFKFTHGLLLDMWTKQNQKQDMSALISQRYIIYKNTSFEDAIMVPTCLHVITAAATMLASASHNYTLIFLEQAVAE